MSTTKYISSPNGSFAPASEVTSARIEERGGTWVVHVLMEQKANNWKMSFNGESSAIIILNDVRETKGLARVGEPVPAPHTSAPQDMDIPA